MTARDSYVSQREDEVAALRPYVRNLEARIAQLEAENADLRQKLSGPKKLKVGPPQHPGQLSIGGTEEAK